MRAGIAAVLLGVAPGLALAQAAGTAQSGGERGKGGDAQMDAMVLSKMHHANQMEMQAGRLAMERGATEGVRRYGDLLWRDHRMADSMVEDFAKKRGIQLTPPKPSSPEEMQQMKQQMASMEKLKAAQGPEFDRMFLTAMTSAHEMAIKMVEGAEQGVSPDLGSMLRKMVPILKQHLELARHLSHKAQPSS
jgi:putative membrane protein